MLTLSLSLEDACVFSCLPVMRLAAPEPEGVFEPPPVAPLSPSPCSYIFASTARKVMPDRPACTRAAGMEEGVVDNKDAIRTPVRLHVVCQFFHGQRQEQPAETNDSKRLLNYRPRNAQNRSIAPAIVAVRTGQWLPTCTLESLLACSVGDGSSFGGGGQ